MMALENSPVHGTAIAVGGRGFLFLGRSGSGKSGLAVQMMALGAELIADDQVVLSRQGETVHLSAPDGLRGLIEARSVAIVNAPSVPAVVLAHVVNLDTEAEARLPQLHTCDVLGVEIDLINGRNVPNLASILMLLGRNTRQT